MVFLPGLASLEMSSPQIVEFFTRQKKPCTNNTMYRTVSLIEPARGNPKNSEDTHVRIYEKRIQMKKDETIYVLVEKFVTDHFPHIDFSKEFEEKSVERNPVKEITTLHNDTGISFDYRINNMAKKIESGKEILTPEGTPNAKLVTTKYDELVLFDGHHTALAYMLAGKKYLSEIPHLLVNSPDNTGISDKEIHPFYGPHARKLKDKNWREYTINWFRSGEQQLEPRRQENLGELFEALKSQGRIAVES